KKSGSVVDTPVAPAIREGNLAPKSLGGRRGWPVGGVGGNGARSPRRGSIDLVRTASLARGGGLPFPPAVAALAVAAEGERRLDLELAPEAGPPLLATLLTP